MSGKKMVRLLDLKYVIQSIYLYGTEHSTQVVVKVFQGNPQELKKIEQRVLREIAAWRYLDHPNVSRFLGIAYLLPNRPPGLVSQYLRHNDLLEFVGEDFDKKVQKVSQDLPQLDFSHVISGKRNCMWPAIPTCYGRCAWGRKSREWLTITDEMLTNKLRKANVLLADDGVAQVNDFGVSQIIGVRGFTTKICHNIRHNAPEIMPITEKDDQDVKPTKQSDIFSLGILLLQVNSL